MTVPPDPLELISGIDMNRRRLRADVREQLTQPSSMEILFNVEPMDYSDIAVSSPFQALPAAASGAVFSGLDLFESIAVFESTDPDDPDYPTTYKPKDQASADDPAKISELPTSTTNPERPRTVAAGYDPARQVLTVVFRDGTFWNYYLESLGKAEANRVWQNFKRARSKGRFILSYLNRMPYGPADVAKMNPLAREQLYRLSRTGQIIRRGYTGKQKPGSRRGTGYGSKIGGTGRARAKRGKP